jgi:hypothetical protein
MGLKRAWEKDEPPALVLARNADAANMVAIQLTDHRFANRHAFKMGERRRRVKPNAGIAATRRFLAHRLS